MEGPSHLAFSACAHTVPMVNAVCVGYQVVVDSFTRVSYEQPSTIASNSTSIRSREAQPSGSTLLTF